MRIIRFLDSDGLVHQGARAADGPARLVQDPLNILGTAGPTPDPRLARPWYAGRTAVVADDDENMRRILAAVLETLGCRVRLCSDGAMARAALESETPDLLVSDIAMPGATGIELYDAARRARADMPILLITGFGYDPTHTLVRVAELGHKNVLYKPFAPLGLIHALNDAVRDALAQPRDGLVLTRESRSVERLLAPLIPTAVVCVGSNYPPAPGRPAPVRPAPRSLSGNGGGGVEVAGAAATLEVFLKPPSSVCGPAESIRLPEFAGIDPRVDCEGELAVVIGRRTHRISPDDVEDCLVGYTLAGDVTARAWQTPTGPPLWMRGKGFDTFCPLGPEIVAPDAFGPPASYRGRTLRTLVNGVVVREGLIGDQLVPVPELVAELSQHMTLHPGTVILTGAPPTVDPAGPVPLAAGDEVIIELEGIGHLVNPVTAE